VLYVRHLCTHLYMSTMSCACMRMLSFMIVQWATGLIYFMNTRIELISVKDYVLFMFTRRAHACERVRERAWLSIRLSMDRFSSNLRWTSYYKLGNFCVCVCLRVCLYMCMSVCVCLSGYTFPHFTTDLLQIWREHYMGHDTCTKRARVRVHAKCACVCAFAYF
jgi:hypothetical protein